MLPGLPTRCVVDFLLVDADQPLDGRQGAAFPGEPLTRDGASTHIDINAD
jgi:hypothetical protein